MRKSLKSNFEEFNLYSHSQLKIWPKKNPVQILWICIDSGNRVFNQSAVVNHLLCGIKVQTETENNKIHRTVPLSHLIHFKIQKRTLVYAQAHSMLVWLLNRVVTNSNQCALTQYWLCGNHIEMDIACSDGWSHIKPIYLCFSSIFRMFFFSLRQHSVYNATSDKRKLNRLYCS